MNVFALNSTSVVVTWKQEVDNRGGLTDHQSDNILYEITAKPIDPCETCKKVEESTRSTSIVLDDLELLAEYEFSVQALNCFGKLDSNSQSKSGVLPVR